MVGASCYFAAHSGGGLGGAFGNLNLTTFPIYTRQTIAAGAFNASGGAFYNSSGYDIPTVTTDPWVFGFICDNGGYWYWQGGASPNAFMVAVAGHTVGSGGTLVGTHFGFADGSIAAFGTYFIIEFYQRISGSWVKRFMGLDRGGTETNPQLNLRRSGGWIQSRLNDIPFDYEPVPVRYQDGTDGLIVFEGPFYLGPSWARDFYLHGDKIWAPRPYELAVA
jgi:hypothetical protein